MAVNASKWSIRNIYLYLVCFVTLMIVVFSFSSLVYNLMGIAYSPPVYNPPVIEKSGGMSEEERAQLQAYQDKYSQQSDRYHSIRSSVQSGVLILIACPMYLYHWRKIQEEAARDKE